MLTTCWPHADGPQVIVWTELKTSRESATKRVTDQRAKAEQSKGGVTITQLAFPPAVEPKVECVIDVVITNTSRAARRLCKITFLNTRNNIFKLRTPPKFLPALLQPRPRGPATANAGAKADADAGADTARGGGASSGDGGAGTNCVTIQLVCRCCVLPLVRLAPAATPNLATRAHPTRITCPSAARTQPASPPHTPHHHTTTPSHHHTTTVGCWSV